MRLDLRRRRLYRRVGRFVSIAVAIGMSVWRAREAKNVDLWLGPLGDPDEVKARACSAGWRRARQARATICAMTARACLCFAPTRSGKGVGLVVPSLLTWPGSAIVHDIKGENWTLTAGFRARHGRVLLFDPTNAKSAAYNPLLEVRRGEWEVRDVQNIADVLVDPEGSLEKRNHWEKTSMRCWSARSCMSSMPRPTRRWPASPPSCPIRSARSSRRWRR
jgi:type IV secretion system protein VirD4